MKKELNTNEFIQIILSICDNIEKEKDYLSELDRATGDGDHGVTMSIGWNAVKEKITTLDDNLTFDKICEGKSFFQRLYLTASDNIQFNNAVINLEGWPSLWVPHLSLYYGNELPNSFPSKSFDNIIPITVTFDTLGLYKTGPIVSEWKEITTLFLD